MNYETLSTFDGQKIFEGMETYYQNAQDLLDTGCHLADKAKYGLATALTVLSIEEMVKSYATFQVYIGETNPDNIDPAFKANNIHKTRLKLASVYNLVFNLLNKDRLDETFTQKVELMDNCGEDKFHTKDKLLEWVDDIIDTIIHEEIAEAIEVSANFEDEINKEITDHSNWYSHAQKTKEKGLYADYLDNKWHLPQNMTKNDYDKAYTCATDTFEKIGIPIKEMIDGNDLKREIIKRIINKIKHRWQQTV